MTHRDDSAIAINKFRPSYMSMIIYEYRITAHRMVHRDDLVIASDFIPSAQVKCDSDVIASLQGRVQ